MIGLGKRAFYDQIERAEPDAYEHVRPVMAANAADADAQEGIAAFLEKRPPEWPGADRRRSPTELRLALAGGRVHRVLVELGQHVLAERLDRLDGGVERRVVGQHAERHLVGADRLVVAHRVDRLFGRPHRDGTHLDRLVHLLERDRRLQRRHLVDAGGLRERVEVLRDQRRVVVGLGVAEHLARAVAVLHASSSRW